MANGISQLENRDWVFKQDAEVRGHFIRSDGRYVLEEYFSQLPQLNATIDQVHTVELARQANKHFEILGTNASDDDVTFSSTFAGLQLQTDGGDNDQVIVLPHLDSGATAWTGVKWGTENQVVWECALRTDSSVAAILLWAGLKLTNTPTIATDDDQVFFRFSTDDSNSNWRCISSVAGTDTNTDSGVAVAASTTYKLRIVIDSARKAEFWIDNVLVHKTGALTNDVDLIPYVGVQALGGAVKTLHLGYEKISRILFE